MILGIDPGLSGGMVVLSRTGEVVLVVPFIKYTPHDIAGYLEPLDIDQAFLEGVNAFPKQGVTSVFKFGTNYGWWQGVLTVLQIPFQRVYPLKWQTAMNCRTGGNKNISKARAQELFPALKVTHAIADALLIAEYGRRQENKQPTEEL